MKFTVKYYKVLKIKKYLKNTELILFYTSTDFDAKIWFTVEKRLKNLALKHYKLHNKITKKIFSESIYKKFKSFISGPIILGVFKILPNSIFSTFFIINSTLIFIGIKLNKTFYLINQMKSILFIKYKTSILIFYNVLKKNTGVAIKIL